MILHAELISLLAWCQLSHTSPRELLRSLFKSHLKAKTKTLAHFWSGNAIRSRLAYHYHPHIEPTTPTPRTYRHQARPQLFLTPLHAPSNFDTSSFVFVQLPAEKILANNSPLTWKTKSHFALHSWRRSGYLFLFRPTLNPPGPAVILRTTE